MKREVITINEVAPMLNGSGGLKNMHFQVYRKLREKWVWLVRSSTKAIFKGTVKITYTRSSVVAPDWDNLSASFKPIGDALVDNKVITDDNPKVVLEFIPKWRKAKNNKDLITIIEVEEYEF
jgi:Holliday junction resolvase RusA-like endonuclease